MNITNLSNPSISNDNQMINMLQPLKQQQQPSGSIAQTSQKTIADTGTDIWLSNANKLNQSSNLNKINSWSDVPQPVSGGQFSSNDSQSPSPMISNVANNENNWSPNSSKNNLWPSQNNVGPKWNQNDSQLIASINKTNNNANFASMTSQPKNDQNQWNNSQQQQQAQQTTSHSSSPSLSRINQPNQSSSSSSSSSLSIPANSVSSNMTAVNNAITSSDSYQANQISANNWNAAQQTPPPPATSNLASSSLNVQSATALLNKVPIEPCGWDDPDFKAVKKSDDGTNIWGDPENQRQIKVQKWSYCSKQMPNPQTIQPVVSENETQQQFPQQPAVNISVPVTQQLQQQQTQNQAAQPQFNRCFRKF